MTESMQSHRTTGTPSARSNTDEYARGVTGPRWGNSAVKDGVPYYERVQKLSERLNSLQSGIEGERLNRIEMLHSKLKSIDERLVVATEGSSKRFQVVRDNMLKIQKDIEEESNTRERIIEAKDSELRRVDEQHQTAVEEEQSARRECESVVLKAVDDTCGQLRDQLSKDSRRRTELEGTVRRYIDTEIPRLYDALREEVAARESTESRVARRAQDDISRLTEMVALEKKLREESEDAVIKMMEEVVLKLQSDINEEKKEREVAESTLLRLLEDTCTKLNASVALGGM